MNEGGRPGAGETTLAAAPSLSALYRAHWAELCAFVRRTFGPGPPEPEDAVQAAFAQYASLADADAIDNPRAYLFRSARNFVLDQRRRQGVHARFTGEIVRLKFPDAPADENPERVLESKQRLAALNAAIRELEPRRRKVLIWHAIHGLSYAEIARRMQLSSTRVIQLCAEAIAACERAARAAEGDNSPLT